MRSGKKTIRLLDGLLGSGPTRGGLQIKVDDREISTPDDKYEYAGAKNGEADQKINSKALRFYDHSILLVHAG